MIFMCDASAQIAGTVNSDPCGGAPIYRDNSGARIGTTLPVGWRPCCCGDVSGGGGGGGSEPAVFRVVGADILRPGTLAKFAPLGVNVGAKIIDGAYAFTQPYGWAANGHSDDAIDWGFNTIRVNIADVGPGVTVADTIAGVGALVDEYTARNIVVIITHFGPGAGSDVAFADAAWDEARAVIAGVIASRLTNTYLWVNFANEPDSGANPPSGYWSTFQNAAYSWLRTVAFWPGIIVADGPAYAQWSTTPADLTADIAAASTFVFGKTDVVLAWHNYGAIGVIFPAAIADPAAITAAADAFVAAGLPIIIGETGCDWNTVRKHYSAISYSCENAGMVWSTDPAHFSAYGFGAIAWHATGSEGAVYYSLRMNSIEAWWDAGSLEAFSDTGTRLLALAGISNPDRVLTPVVFQDFDAAANPAAAGFTAQLADPGQIAAGHLAASAAGADCLLVHGTSAGADDIYVQAVLIIGAGFTGANCYTGITARHDPAVQTYYQLRMEGGQNMSLIRYVAGVPHVLDTYDNPSLIIAGSNLSIRMEVRGSNIRCYIGTLLIMDCNDTGIPTGSRGGFFSSSSPAATTTTIDSFTVGTIN